MKITQKQYKQVREEAFPYECQETLAAGIARGRLEERQNICQVMRQLLSEIVETRFPKIAEFTKERIRLMDNFSVLYQFAFVISTVWSQEDVLRFLLALDDAHGYTH